MIFVEMFYAFYNLCSVRLRGNLGGCLLARFICFTVAFWFVSIFVVAPSACAAGFLDSAQEILGSRQDIIWIYAEMSGLFFVLFFFFFGITLFLVRHRDYVRFVGNLKSTRMRVVSCVCLSCFVLCIFLATFFCLHSVKQKSLNERSFNQETSLTLTNDALNLWVAEKTGFVKQFGENPTLYGLVRRLLLLQDAAVSTSEELGDVRFLFMETVKEVIDVSANVNFNIMDENAIIIASMYDEPLGQFHVITQEHPDYISRVFAGETFFVPPVRSQNPFNMFVMGPIRGADGTVIAVFALCLDPADEFSRVIGDATDHSFSNTYAFSASRQFLSHNNYEPLLVQAGLLREGQRIIRTVELRDPGVNITQKQPNLEEFTEWPLTYMVDQALVLKSKLENVGVESGTSVLQHNNKGYKDFRGVTVVGAWLWNFDLGIGLATEFDLDRALANYDYLKYIISTILLVTLVLNLGATFFVLGLGARNSRILSKAKKELEEEIERRTIQLEHNQLRLKESEERSRLILSTMGEGLFQIDTNERCVFINKAAQKMFGYGVGEVLGKPLQQIIAHKEEQKDVDCLVVQALKDGVKVSCPDALFWRKDGSCFPVEFSATPVEQHGIITGVVVVVTDVTEAKRTSQALQLSEERYALVVRGSDDGIWDWNVENIEIYCSPRMKELVGINHDEAVSSKMWRDWVHPDDLENLVVESDLCLAGVRENYGVEYRVKDGADGWRWILDRAVSVQDETGKVIRLAGTFSDITNRKRAEQKIKESEELLRFSLVAVGAYYWEGSTHSSDKIYDSPQLFLDLGYDEEEIPTTIEECIAITHPDEQEAARKAYSDHIADASGMFRIETRYRRKDGSYNWVLNVGRVIKGGDTTKRDKLVGLTLDIDEQKKNQQLLETLFEAIPVSLIVLDVRSRKILRVNQAGLEFAGLTEDEMLARNPSEMLVDAAVDIKRLLQATEDGKQIELEIQRMGSGEPRWVLFKGAFVEYEGKASILGSYSDISSSKHSQRRLVEKQQFLQAVIDNSGALISVKDLVGRYILANDGWFHSLGLDKMYLLGKRDVDIFSSDVVDASASLENEAIAMSKPVYSEDKITINDKSNYFQSVRFPLFDADSKVYAVCSILTDVTAYKDIEGDLQTRVHQLAQAQKAMSQVMADLENEKFNAETATRAKSDFLANMSHEIRTPMNAVMGMTHLALKTDLDGKQKNYLQKIDSSAQALLAIINDILDFSKIEAGKMSIEKTEFCLTDVIVALSDSLGFQLKNKGLELIVRIAPDVPLQLDGDPLRIGQILLNLGHNSTKFTDHGEIEVGVEVVGYVENNVSLKFSVRDTGIGLSPPQQKCLFQSFSQADTSTTRKYGGTGLGLTICKQLAELMGGEIGVESAPGQGSTFWFTAQLGANRASTVAERTVVDFVDRPVLILVARGTLQNILIEMMSQLKCRIVCASSVAEALAVAGGVEQFELVLMDWTLQEDNALSALEHIIYGPNIITLPPTIVCASALSEAKMKRTCALGRVFFLEKPVQPIILFEMIREIFSDDSVSPYGVSIENQPFKGLKTFSGERVLLVEDNEINQEVAVEVLSGFNLQVVVACNGQEAIDIFQRQEFSFILMDIQMPVMDGVTATVEIRKLEKGKDIPIVAMTAHAMVGDREKNIDAGMDEHITKPIDPKVLNMTLAKWLGGSVLKPAEVQITKKTVFAQLKKVPGIDIDDGLLRFGDNEKLYLKLLNKFVADYGNVAAQIQRYVDSEDFESALRLAHTMKGVGGNIGAKYVYQKAMEVEAALKTDGDDLAGVLAQFNIAVEVVCASIDNLPTVTGDDHEEPLVECSAEQLQEMLGDIYFLLADDFAAAMDQADEFMATLKGLGVDDEVMALTEAIDSFDSDGALEQVKSMASVLNVELDV